MIFLAYQLLYAELALDFVIMMCVQDTFAILGTLLVTQYWLGASHTSDMLSYEKRSLFLF